MADNVAVSAGTGTTVAADEISDATLGSCKVQYIKIMDGTLDGTTKATVGANGLYVDVRSSAAVTANLNTGTNAIGRVGHDITGIGHGVKTVASAGTDEALAASTACKKVVIQAQTDNTGLIAVGGSGVDATVATGTGIILYPGDAFEVQIDNLADVYIDSTVNGEGVRYTYFT